MTIVVFISLNATAADRIVSLKPNITEILFALGAGDRVVGVTTWCNFPAAAATRPKVADYIAPNVEKVLAVAPDLVIGSRENGLKQPVEQLERAGIPVVALPFDTIPHMMSSIMAIGDLVNTPVAARTLVARLTHNLDLLHAIPSAQPSPRTLIAVGHVPLVAAAPNSLLGTLLGLVHGENIMTSTALPYPRPTLETILARDPEVIIDVSGTMGEPSTDWMQPLGSVAAVRNKRIVTISTDLFRPGPRLAEGMRAMAEAIHQQGVAGRQSAARRAHGTWGGRAADPPVVGNR